MEDFLRVENFRGMEDFLGVENFQGMDDLLGIDDLARIEEFQWLHHYPLIRLLYSARKTMMS